MWVIAGLAGSVYATYSIIITQLRLLNMVNILGNAMIILYEPRPNHVSNTIWLICEVILLSSLHFFLESFGNFFHSAI